MRWGGPFNVQMRRLAQLPHVRNQTDGVALLGACTVQHSGEKQSRSIIFTYGASEALHERRNIRTVGLRTFVAFYVMLAYKNDVSEVISTWEWPKHNSALCTVPSRNLDYNRTMGDLHKRPQPSTKTDSACFNLTGKVEAPRRTVEGGAHCGFSINGRGWNPTGKTGPAAMTLTSFRACWRRKHAATAEGNHLDNLSQPNAGVGENDSKRRRVDEREYR